MKTLKLFRTFNEGFQNFRRDAWLTVVTIIVMSLALYLMGIAFFSGYGILNALNNLEDKVNISMNFDFDVSEEDILNIKKEIEKIEEVKSVTYIPSDEAFERMKNTYGSDEIYMQVLDTIGQNPYPSSLIIVAKDSSDYEKIDKYLKDNYEDKLLNNKQSDYDSNKTAMDNIHRFIAFVRNVSLGFGLIMIFVAILLNLNTIRMSLYANRKEFEIMRLVGASNLYVKLPTIFEGFLYGLTSSILTIICLIGTVFATSSYIKTKIPEIDIAGFYVKHLFEMGLIVVVAGIFISTLSSYLAIRRYLEK